MAQETYGRESVLLRICGGRCAGGGGQGKIGEGGRRIPLYVPNPAGGVFSIAVQVPRRLLQVETASGASPLNDRSAEEAGSRPFCGLVLCNFLLYQVGSLSTRDHVLPLLQGAFLERAANCAFPLHLHYAPGRTGCQAGPKRYLQDMRVRYRMRLCLACPVLLFAAPLPGARRNRPLTHPRRNWNTVTFTDLRFSMGETDGPDSHCWGWGGQ